jgi:hypothetical protein
VEEPDCINRWGYERLEENLVVALRCVDFLFVSAWEKTRGVEMDTRSVGVEKPD